MQRWLMMVYTYSQPTPTQRVTIDFNIEWFLIYVYVPWALMLLRKRGKHKSPPWTGMRATMLGKLDTQHVLFVLSFEGGIRVPLSTLLRRTQNTTYLCRSTASLHGISLPDFSCSWIGYRDTSQYTDNLQIFKSEEVINRWKSVDNFRMKIHEKCNENLWKILKKIQFSKTNFKKWGH